MKPVLITGATGFLGKHLVDQLRARGTPLRLLCRGPSAYDDQPGIEIAHGDVTDANAVDRAMTGAGNAYHLAGLVSRDPDDHDKLFHVHVKGTLHVCEAALRHSVDRVVIVSSSGTIAVSKKPLIHDETAGFQHNVTRHWGYYASKIAAEEEVLALCRTKALPAVIVNPALLLGPGDDRGSSTGDIVHLFEGQIMTYPTGGMSFVDARDAAAGTIAAMERGRIGECYLLGGVNWTFKRIIQETCRIAGLKPPLMSSPTALARLSAPLLRALMPLIGRKFTLDDETIAMSGHFWYCDSTKAIRELGFHARDPLETLRDTIDDLRARGVV
ncbi:MAG: NAD-dependent epimerase/dehydratase family protein [Acidobacteriota bacterium]